MDIEPLPPIPREHPPRPHPSRALLLFGVLLLCLLLAPFIN